MVLENMINMQLMMFLLVALGFWVRKKENHRRHGKKTIRRFLFIYYASVQYFSFLSIKVGAEHAPFFFRNFADVGGI